MLHGQTSVARSMTGPAQQADIARRLAAWAAILAVPTAVVAYTD